MSATLLVATRKGLFTVERAGRGWRDRRGRLRRRQRHHDALRSARRHAATPRSTTATSAPSCTARPRRRLGGDRRAGLSAASRGPVEHDMWGQPLAWSTAASGRWRPAARRARRRRGAAPCPAACSARTTAASPGSWSRRCGTIPSASSGSAAAPTCPASTRSASHPRRSRRVLRRRVCGGVWVTRRRRRDLDAARPTACAPRTCRPEQADDPEHPGPHRVVQCRGRRDCSGPSTTTASSARPTAPEPGTEITSAPPSTLRLRRRRPSRRSRARAWFVPAHARTSTASRSTATLVVNRTRDGGTSFETLRRRPAAGARLRPRLPPRASTSTPPARGWPSAAPPAAAGSSDNARRRAGSECRRTCRRSTRSLRRVDQEGAAAGIGQVIVIVEPGVWPNERQPDSGFGIVRPRSR